MQFNLLLVTSVAILPIVTAHGKISVVSGDAGGNGTALAIKGAIVPGAGSNDVTEVDTTVFGSTKLRTDGLGRTTGSGKNQVKMIKQAMALSGDTLPQVSANGGSISGTVHIVTTDGAGPFHAMIDPSGTGKFSAGTRAKIATQVPGNKGNIRPDGTVKKSKKKARSITGRALFKRAANVDRDFPIKINIPAGTTCNGTMGGQNNVCLLKIANSNPAGPFGGVIAFQMAPAAAAAAPDVATAGAKVVTPEVATACQATKRDIPLRERDASEDDDEDEDEE